MVNSWILLDYVCSTVTLYMLKNASIRAFCLICIGALILGACQRRRLMQQAIYAEGQGNTTQAIAIYYDLCNSYSEGTACAAFRRLIEVKADSLIMLARGASSSGNCDQTLQWLSEAEDVMRDFPGHQIDLGSFHSARFSIMDRCYGQLLAQAEESLMNGDFDKAIRFASLVSASYSGYEKAMQISRLARFSILYELAEKSRGKGEWADAYENYSAIYNEDKNFRDVKERMIECLSYTRKSLAYVSVKSSVVDERQNRRMESAVREEIKSIMGDRIQILERTELDVLLEQHRIQMQASFDDETGSSLGLLERAAFFLTVEWIDLSYFESPSRRESCNCSAVYGISNEYADCFRTYTALSAKADIKIQLLQASSGEVLMTHLITRDETTNGLRHEMMLNSKGEKLKTSGKMPVLQDPGDIMPQSQVQLQEELMKQLAIQVAARVKGAFDK